MILSFSILVFEIPMGVVSDCLGHRRTLILSQWMILIARILLWYATSMEVFIAEAIIEAVGNSLSSGTLEAYIYADEPEKYAVKIAKIGNRGTFFKWDKFESGLETNIDGEARNVSGGELQKLCLARIILEDRPLIILDEPTAAMDIESEKNMCRAEKNFTWKNGAYCNALRENTGYM